MRKLKTLDKFIDLVSFGSLSTNSIDQFAEIARSGGYRVRLWETSAKKCPEIRGVEVNPCVLTKRTLIQKIRIFLIRRLGLPLSEPRRVEYLGTPQERSWAAIQSRRAEDLVPASTSLIVALDQTSVYAVWHLSHKCQAPSVFGLAAALLELEKLNYI